MDFVLQNYVARHNPKGTLSTVKDLLQEARQDIVAHDRWADYVKHTNKVEEEYVYF